MWCLHFRRTFLTSQLVATSYFAIVWRKQLQAVAASFFWTELSVFLLSNPESHTSPHPTLFSTCKMFTSSIQPEPQCGRINGHQAIKRSSIRLQQRAGTHSDDRDSSTYGGVFSLSLSPSLTTKVFSDSETKQLSFECVASLFQQKGHRVSLQMYCNDIQTSQTEDENVASMVGKCWMLFVLMYWLNINI